MCYLVKDHFVQIEEFIYIFSDESKEVRDAVETYHKSIEDENSRNEKHESTGQK